MEQNIDSRNKPTHTWSVNLWQREKRAAEDGIVRKHRQLNGHEFKQTLGDSGGQRSLVCCSPWGHNKSDLT